MNAWEDMSKMMGAMTWAYAATHSTTPTIEELTSELEAATKSHLLANRALTNMSVALSHAMDRNVAYEETIRKMKLEHQKEIARLEETIDTNIDKLTEARKRADAAEGALAEERRGQGPDPEATGVGG